MKFLDRTGRGLQDILLTQSVSPFTSNTLLPILNPLKREQRREGSSALWDQELEEEPKKGWRPHTSEASGGVFARWELDLICHKVFQWLCSSYGSGTWNLANQLNICLQKSGEIFKVLLLIVFPLHPFHFLSRLEA